MLSRQLIRTVSFAGARRSGSTRWTRRAILNDAYRTLKDPVARAEYLLKEKASTSASRGRRTFRRNCSKKFSS